MELQPHNRQVPISNSHHHAVGGTSRNDQTRRQRGFVHDQRVIAARGQRIRQAGKHALSVVKHVADAAMHRFGSSHDFCPRRRRNDLMPQADAQHGNRFGKPSHHIQRAPGFQWRAGPRRQHDRARLPTHDVVQAEGVVANHDRLLAQSLQIAG